MNAIDDEWEEEPTQMRVVNEKGLSKSAKVYQLWSGNNRFYCSGRIMVGPIDDIGVIKFMDALNR
jgi:hypothetical protein